MHVRGCPRQASHEHLGNLLDVRQALVAHAQALVRKNNYKDALPLLRRALQLKSDNNLEDYAQRVERAARNQS